MGRIEKEEIIFLAWVSDNPLEKIDKIKKSRGSFNLFMDEEINAKIHKNILEST